MHGWLFTLCATLLSIAGIACAKPPIGTTTLVYEFSRSGLALAEMTDVLQVRAGEYELVSNAKGVGILAVLALGQTIRRESRGAIGADGLLPRSFVEQRGANYRLSADFDWQAREIAGAAGRRRPGPAVVSVSVRFRAGGAAGRLQCPGRRWPASDHLCVSSSRYRKHRYRAGRGQGAALHQGPVRQRHGIRSLAWSRAAAASCARKLCRQGWGPV